MNVWKELMTVMLTQNALMQCRSISVNVMVDMTAMALYVKVGTIMRDTCSCSGLYSLTDVDECLRSEDDCDVNAKCTNTDGGHNCSCNNGFHGNGSFCCELSLTTCEVYTSLLITLLCNDILSSRGKLPDFQNLAIHNKPSCQSVNFTDLI